MVSHAISWSSPSERTPNERKSRPPNNRIVPGPVNCVVHSIWYVEFASSTSFSSGLRNWMEWVP